MRQIYSFFKQNILAGVLVTVPFGLTLFILFKLGAWIVSLLSAAPARLIGSYLAELPKGLYEAALFLIGLLGTLLVVLFIGAVARNFVGRKLVDFGEAIISKIPLSRTIYVATKQVINTLFVGTRIKSPKSVALLEFPRKGVYSIGFITGSLEPGVHQNKSDKKLLSLFIPTSPNPTTGYYIMLPEEDVTELPITIEEAFKIIMSAGLATNNVENALPDKKND